jgi:hypothetical protein
LLNACAAGEELARERLLGLAVEVALRAAVMG